MSGLILIEREILQSNPYGSVFIGADRKHLKHVNKPGDYPAARGIEKNGISVTLEHIGDTNTLMLILPYLHSIWLKVRDSQSKETHTMSLLGKDSSLNVGAYQLESLGSKLIYLNGKVRVFSLEAAQAASNS